jgi:glutaredoxin
MLGIPTARTWQGLDSECGPGVQDAVRASGARPGFIAENGSMTSPSTLTLFGADWCRDCVRTKRQLDELGISYSYVDLVADPAAADVAREISGRTNIPVVVYPDASHHVEPSNADVESKLRELSLI